MSGVLVSEWLYDHPFVGWLLCIVVPLSLLGGVVMFFWVLAGYALGVMH